MIPKVNFLWISPTRGGTGEIRGKSRGKTGRLGALALGGGFLFHLFFWLCLIFLPTSLFHTELIGGAENDLHDFPVVWEISDGLKAPESAYLDEQSGLLFLSQIGDIHRNSSFKSGLDLDSQGQGAVLPAE